MIARTIILGAIAWLMIGCTDQQPSEYTEYTLALDAKAFIWQLSGKSYDVAFNQALDKAEQVYKQDSEQDFIQLFAKAYQAQDSVEGLAVHFAANRQLATISANSSDEAVVEAIQAIYDSTLSQSSRVLDERLKSFGIEKHKVDVDQANQQLVVAIPLQDSTVEVETAWQLGGDFSIWTLYRNTEVMPLLDLLNRKLQKDSLASDQKALFELMQPYQDGSAMLGVVASDKFSVFKQLIQSAPFMGRMPKGAKVVLTTTPFEAEDGNLYYTAYMLKERTDLDHRFIVSAMAMSLGSEMGVALTMNEKGKRIWHKLTEENIGRELGIVLDGQLYSAPRVQEPITNGKTTISGGFSAREASELAEVLGTNVLPSKLVFVGQRTIKEE